MARAVEVVVDVTAHYRLDEASADQPNTEVHDATHNEMERKQRPLGTYAGACRTCGHVFTKTLFWDETHVRCPECFAMTSAAEFRPHYLYI